MRASSLEEEDELSHTLSNVRNGPLLGAKLNDERILQALLRTTPHHTETLLLLLALILVLILILIIILIIKIILVLVF
mgnify:CR=1 FL=1